MSWLLALWLTATPLGNDPVRDDVSWRIGEELRCPVCQGMPIAESPSEMAQAMMKRVRELAAEGKSEQEIKQYFVDRYGEWVLLAPEQKGFNWVVWVLPPVALVLAGVFVLSVARKPKSASEATQKTPATNEDDPYLAAVRRAVDDDRGDA